MWYQLRWQYSCLYFVRHSIENFWMLDLELENVQPMLESPFFVSKLVIREKTGPNKTFILTWRVILHQANTISPNVPKTRPNIHLKYSFICQFFHYAIMVSWIKRQYYSVLARGKQSLIVWFWRDHLLENQTKTNLGKQSSLFKQICIS